MTARIEAFMAKIRNTTYPEPRTEVHENITREMIKRVLPRMRPGGAVLDVGCGSGPALEQFKALGVPAIGVTVNESDLKACLNQGFDVRERDMNDLAFDDGRFGMVWARHVLEHSVIPMWTLAEFNRVLDTGGILYVEVPGPDTACVHEANPNHFSVMGWKAWYSLIAKSGFEVLEARRIDLQTAVGDDHYLAFIAKKP